MGLLDRFKKPEAPPAAPASKSKRAGTGDIVCSCGKSFKTSEKHHAHMHAEHPEHRH